jgi:hypothetical protein
MKYSIKGLIVILAIVFSLVVVQSVISAETFEAEGCITAMQTYPNKITIKTDDDEIYDVYGICYVKLEKEGVNLKLNQLVEVEYYEFLLKNGTIKNMALALDGVEFRSLTKEE